MRSRPRLGAVLSLAAALALSGSLVLAPLGDAGPGTTATSSAIRSITGGPNSDLLRGGSRADRILGGAAADRIRGRGGNDRLFGGPGNDQLHGRHDPHGVVHSTRPHVPLAG